MDQIWRTTLDALDSDGIPVQQRAFLSLAKLVGLLDETALIAVPNDFTKDIVETRLRDRVTETLRSQLGHDVRLAVTVDPSLGDAPVLAPAEDGSSTDGLDGPRRRSQAGPRRPRRPSRVPPTATVAGRSAAPSSTGSPWSRTTRTRAATSARSPARARPAPCGHARAPPSPSRWS